MLFLFFFYRNNYFRFRFAQTQQFSARRLAGGAFYSSMPTVFGEAPTNGLPFAEYFFIDIFNFDCNVSSFIF